jgi:virginiamycin A acetyltransferase
MPFSRLANHLRARWRNLTVEPNWIDPACRVHRDARVMQSRLSGAVDVAAHATLYRVEISGQVEVGYSTSLWGPDIEVHARRNPIRIGNYCSIARGVSLYEYRHDYERLSTYYIGRNVLGRPLDDEIESKGPIDLGHDVWIGAYAHVLSGVTVGNGAVVAANAVVTRDVPPFAIVAGSPARVLKYRFDEPTRARIAELAWWNWDRDTVRKNGALFTGKYKG